MTGPSHAGINEEVLEVASELIRIDTSNPPGHETRAAEYLARYLQSSGLEVELIGPDPARLNLVSRISGAGDGPSVMFMAHTDVVPAPVANWTVPPFAAVERDGFLVGRGAVDMKNELAARAVAFSRFARSGVRPRGDIVFVAESDEERNVSDVGMSWLVRERPDLVCDFALNEGGGLVLDLADGTKAVTVSIGEKVVTSLKLSIFGTAAHASIPDRKENTLLSTTRAVERLFAYQPPVSVSASVRRSLETLGAPDGDETAQLEWFAAQHPVLEGLVPAMTRMSVTPTGLATHEPANVIPPLAEIICDCRALPGQTEADVRRHVDEALGSGIDYELEFLEPMEGGFESGTDSALYRLIARYVEERLPGSVLLPMVTPGFTDSH
ncbi:MAG: M20/M25/M40 family metallo-hydrolase, partial [Actinomycetota bacterium]|nr:M20/M25/M40 family metallo-hydrolase [Actinomycetota bacterium]